MAYGTPTLSKIVREPGFFGTNWGHIELLVHIEISSQISVKDVNFGLKSKFSTIICFEIQILVKNRFFFKRSNANPKNRNFGEK